MQPLIDHVLGVVAPTALPLMCSWTSENISQDPPPSFSLSFPWHSQPHGHVESHSLTAPEHRVSLPRRAGAGSRRMLRRERGGKDSVRNRVWRCRTNVGELRTWACRVAPTVIWTENGTWNGSKQWFRLWFQILENSKWKEKNKCLKMALCTNNTNYSHSCELIAIFPNHHAAYWQWSIPARMCQIN